jgi:porphobilinogen synthase
MSMYPALRLRRTRSTAWSRALVCETYLAPAHLIWPLFVTSGESVEEPIASLPGVSRWSVDGIVAPCSRTPRANCAPKAAKKRLTPTI